MLPWSFKGGTEDVQTSPWTLWSTWSFEHVQNSRTNVAEEIGPSKEAGGRHTHRRGRRMDAHWSAIGRPVKKCVLLWTLCINLSDASAFPDCITTVPPFADRWRPLSDHCDDHCASIRRPRQLLSHHNNGSTSTLPSLCDLLRHYSSFGRSGKAQWSCCNSYTERELSGFGRPLSVLTIFLVARRWHEGRSPV